MNDMQSYERWESQKADLDRLMDDIQVAMTSAKTARERRQMERQFNALAKRRQRMSNFCDWADGRR